MITFLIAVAALVIAYFTYGKYIEKVIGPNAERPTPAYSIKTVLIMYR